MCSTGTGPIWQKSKQCDSNAQVIKVLGGGVAEVTRARWSVKSGESWNLKLAHEDVAKPKVRREHGIKIQWRCEAFEQAETGNTR